MMTGALPRECGIVENEITMKASEIKQETMETNLREASVVQENEETSPTVLSNEGEISRDDLEISSEGQDQKEGFPRYDLIITSERAGYRPPVAGVGAIVRQLAFRGFANPVDEAIAETWSEIYFEPGPAAHEMFIEKAYSQPEPVFHELVFKFTEKPFFCEDISTPQRPLYFAIIIYGARFKSTIGAFKKLFLDTLNLKIMVDVREPKTIPEHRVVSEDEKPIEKKKHERGNGMAGSAVIEV